MPSDLDDGRFRDPRAEPEPLRRYLTAVLEDIPWNEERFMKRGQPNALALRDLSRAHFDAFSLSYSLGEPTARLKHHLDRAVDAHVDYDILSSQQRPASGQEPRTLVEAPTWMIETAELLGAVILLGTAEHRSRIADTLPLLGPDTALEYLAGRHPTLDGIEVTLSHPRPYDRLIAAVQAPPEARPKLVGQFVQHWYNGTRKRQGWGEHLRQQKRGAPIQYPGYWCFSGAALTKLLELDDSSYRDNEYYPEAFLPR
ncbi:MAG: DUF1911 domain-containing protein [Microbacterium sp.]|nr:DUF1911 domain-containing protein [Microbacterium sp.]